MNIRLNSLLNKKSYTYNYKKFILDLFKEDEVDNDLTTRYIAPDKKKATARIIAKESGIIAGLQILKDAFHIYDKHLIIKTHFHDGDPVHQRDIICTIKGRTPSILQSERVALNILQRLSGVANETRMLVDLLKGTPARLLNTRKTTPGMRYLEKYATTVGGALNHRLNLADGILIKENHIMAAGSITNAVMTAYKRKPVHIKIEVEVRNLVELSEALELPVDMIMLDNFSLSTIRSAVEMNKGKKLLEVSGNVNAASIRGIAETGVDYISVGAITHSAHSLDFSLLIYDEFYD